GARRRSRRRTWNSVYQADSLPDNARSHPRDSMPTLKRPGKPDLHYVVDDFTDPWKRAPAILLQHGIARSHRVWFSWVPYLARFYRVVRADLRGMGSSSRDFDLKTGIGLDAWFDDFSALIDELGGPVHYCGESLGGILGVAYAAAHPEKL